MIASKKFFISFYISHIKFPFFLMGWEFIPPFLLPKWAIKWPLVIPVIWWLIFAPYVVNALFCPFTSVMVSGIAIPILVAYYFFTFVFSKNFYAFVTWSTTIFFLRHFVHFITILCNPPAICIENISIQLSVICPLLIQWRSLNKKGIDYLSMNL